MIKPTIGRKVWFTPGVEIDDRDDREQPFDATIVYVHNNDRMVNISYHDHYGNQHGQTSVLMLQEGDAQSPDGNYCEWMPYQKGQAAKTESLEKQVSGESRRSTQAFASNSSVSRTHSFSRALEALKCGAKVARHGWNGRNMFLFMVPGSQFAVNRPPLMGIYEEGTIINYNGHIDIRKADGSIEPWLASQSDMLEDDWYIV